MAKFTTKKKLEAVADAMRNIHIMTRAIKLQAVIVKENKSLISDPEDLKAFNEMLNKCNFYTSRMDKIYSYDEKASKFLKETNGESAIDELSLRILEFIEQTAGEFTADQNKPM
jgi:hypothetical protein